MAAPKILNVYPIDGAAGIVLGTKIQLVFDQVIDTASVNDSTFSLSGPGQTSVITPDQLIEQNPDVVTGREYITGTFSFDNSSGSTVVTFIPSRPLQKNQVYTLTVVGADSSLVTSFVQNPALEAMAASVSWSFTTTNLDIATPPVSSPVPATSRISPDQIVVIPRLIVGNDLTQEIDLIFPDNIDPASFNVNDVFVSIDAMLGDLNVVVPGTLQAAVAVSGRKLTITISGWPPPPPTP